MSVIPSASWCSDDIGQELLQRRETISDQTKQEIAGVTGKGKIVFGSPKQFHSIKKKKKKSCLFFFFFPRVFKIKGLTNRKMLVNFKQQRTCHLERKKSEHCHMGNIKLKHFLISKPKHFHLENVKMRCFDMFKKIFFYYLLGWKHLAHSVSINA